MLHTTLKKIFGDRNQRLLKKMKHLVHRINKLESELKKLSNEDLAAKTDYFKTLIHQGISLHKILPETFAVVRETAVRVIGLRHFDVQLIGGMVLNEGKIAEMKTGEGKTLMATLPAYLHALSGLSVHIVTVNDYLAHRDAERMGKIYNFLGMSVGIVFSGQHRKEKKKAYQRSVVYGTNNEFGFDYLRDNMTFSEQERLQNGLGFAIIDEVDSILIDEARTPLIISGSAEEKNELYQEINTIVPKLTKKIEDNSGDFSIDEKTKQVSLSELGYDNAENLLMESGLLNQGSSLYEVSNIGLLHHLYAALKAHNLFQKDVDYILKDNTIVIIDEFTGRLMSGRRWSDGIHQAIEAKEGVPIQPENKTLASITFQNYFRLYTKLSGMTGTADTESTEFLQIYGLEVVIIPTNLPMIREDLPDLVYRNKPDKYLAICEGINNCKKKDQPVLVGTASIASSELLSSMLKKAGVHHQILNAKNHEKEAEIIAEAGRPGRVTIATNMAGRGTDIVLGGNLEMELSKVKNLIGKEKIQKQWTQRHQKVIDAGGLHILGTERNESRRVDNQLRGRCGRQGDPGSTQFYLSLDDNLMRIFGSNKIAGLMEKLGMEEGDAIEHPWVTRAIENAQKKVEGYNSDMRKQLLEYDDVANEQRKIIYIQRNMLIETQDISEYIRDIRLEVIHSIIQRCIHQNTGSDQWDIPFLTKNLKDTFWIHVPVKEWIDETTVDEKKLREKLVQKIVTYFIQKEKEIGNDSARYFEKSVMLRVLDEQWKTHLSQMDHLRQGIGLRGYAQKNPKQEYKREAFEIFTAMLNSVKFEVIETLSNLYFSWKEDMTSRDEKKRLETIQSHQSINLIQSYDQNSEEVDSSKHIKHNQNVGVKRYPTYVRQSRKIGRNEPCPCGSSKKYKQCHGQLV